METVELAYDMYVTQETDRSRCPIILLHGLFWNKYMFRDLAKDLCITTRRKVFCLDLRNHDKSPFGEECDALVMVEDLKRFIKDRQLEKVSFVCHSFSSTFAYLIVVDQPDVVEKVVMIDHPPYPYYSEEFYRENVLSQFTTQNKFLETLDPNLSLPAAKNNILNLCKGATEAQKMFLKKMAYELMKVNNKFKWRTDHKFLIDRYHEGYLRPTARGSSVHEILIIRCEGSPRVMNEKFDAVLRFNPNAKLMSIPDTGHLLMFEKKDEFLEAVKDFLS